MTGLTRCCACRRICTCYHECICGWVDGATGDFYCNDHDEPISVDYWRARGA